MTIVKDKDSRKALAGEFAKNTDNYQIAQIIDKTMGDKIISHYKTKFKKNLVGGSQASLLFMFLKDKVWLVDQSGRLTRDELNEVAKIMGLDSDLTVNIDEAAFGLVYFNASRGWLLTEK